MTLFANVSVDESEASQVPEELKTLQTPKDKLKAALQLPDLTLEYKINAILEYLGVTNEVVPDKLE
jgi:hypothetical protein